MSSKTKVPLHIKASHALRRYETEKNYAKKKLRQANIVPDLIQMIQKNHLKRGVLQGKIITQCCLLLLKRSAV